MIVCVERFLKYACSGAVLCLVIIQVYTFLNAGLADRQPWRGVTRPDNSSCRALFTVTNVPQRYAPNASLFIHNRYGEVFPHKPSVGWRPRQYPDDLGGYDVAKAVQQLLLKRESPSGASTTDYSLLAALLPSVLAFQGQGEASVPTVTTTTRIGAAGGMLPYVPCEIATYVDPALVTACFRNRLAQQESLWIFFMGDSKVRNLFYEFLARSDEELHYSMKLSNGSTPFAAMDRTGVKLKVDMEATSTKLPGLLISFQFRKFAHRRVSDMRSSRELQQLARWAAGQELPPHLLVLGYMSWSMLNVAALYPQNSLVTLMDMHEQVAPLLQQISHETRVIMTSQSRYKINTKEENHFLYEIPYGDPINDWNEAGFLHYLRRHSGYKPPLPPSETLNPLMETESGLLKPRVGHTGSRPQDHLVPEENNNGVWWWDTSLPLSLAESNECEELYLRGLTNHSMYYNSSFHRCHDGNHVGIVTLGDQVTMLLNLVCNSVLGTREGMCCS